MAAGVCFAGGLSACQWPLRALGRHAGVCQGKFWNESPLLQLAWQACLGAGNAGGDQGGFGGFVTAYFALILQHAPLAAVADDAEST